MKLANKIVKLFGGYTIAEYEDMKKKLELNINVAKHNIEQLQLSLEEKQKLIEELQKKVDRYRQLEKEIPIEDLKEYFLTKWKEGNVLYNMEGEGMVDVRRALRETEEDKNAFDALAETVIKKYRLNANKLDRVPLSVMRWREAYFEGNKYYDSDLKTFGKREYWQRGGLTLEKYKEGFDCDDMAIVMHLLILHILDKLDMGDHAWRLKMAAGNTAIAGHAYNIWLGDDIEWYTVESTLSVKYAIDNWKEKPHRMNGLYGRIWFTFTKERTYSRETFVFDKNDYWKKGGENE